MIATSFREILRETVQKTPGAIGGALAAGDGELVDYWTTWEQRDWAILTAHFGILVSQIRSALHTFHYGDVQSLYFQFDTITVLIEVVAQNYFAILAVMPPVHLPTTTQALQAASQRLRQEML